jgi:hypothetical protein
VNAKTLRMVGWVQVAALLVCIADLAYALQGGNPDGIAVVIAVVIALWLALIAVTTKVIREARRPRG